MNRRSTLHGIDVSSWQGKIDFERVKADGIRIVYIKATQGTNYVDSDFERNYREAQKEGLAIGFYHYVTARNISEAREEARFFVSHIQDKIQHARPAMDFETFGDLSRTEIREIALQFLITLEAETRQKPVIYTDASNASSTFADDRFREYRLWIADYGVVRPDMENPWQFWSGWQFTDRGRINGISGDVDRDYFRREILTDIAAYSCEHITASDTL
ncbi:MAG: hypothetical protein K2L07_09290 [Lachnospiraceae bacterium]|nr:hypothetical protein [Lachnospiraceae bacterium]